MSIEIWKPVVGFETLYEVSSFGRVRSFNKHKEGRLLKPGRCSSGHVSVALGRGNSRMVHRLVAEAFIGPRPHGMDICHNNGDPADNRLENIRYDTRGNNIRDAVKHGSWMTENRLKHCQNLRYHRKEYKNASSLGF